MIVVFNYYFSTPLDERLSFLNLDENAVGNILVQDFALNNSSNSNFGSNSMSTFGNNKLPVYKFRSYTEGSNKSIISSNRAVENTSTKFQNFSSQDFRPQPPSNPEENTLSLTPLYIEANPALTKSYMHQNENASDAKLVDVNFKSLEGLLAQQGFTNAVYLKDNSFNTNNTLALTTDITSINTSQLVDGDPGDPGDPGIPAGDGFGFLVICISIFTFIKHKSFFRFD